MALGSVAVLAAAIVMGTLGFAAGRPAPVGSVTAVVSPTPHGAKQLETLSLTDVRGHLPLGRR